MLLKLNSLFSYISNIIGLICDRFLLRLDPYFCGEIDMSIWNVILFLSVFAFWEALQAKISSLKWERILYTMDRALKIWFSKGLDSFLKSIIPELWKLLQNQLRCVLDKINNEIRRFWRTFCHKIMIFSFQNVQGNYSFEYNGFHVYLTNTKRRTLSLFTKNTQI